MVGSLTRFWSIHFRPMEPTRTRTSCVLDILVTDIFLHMLASGFISKTDLVLLAWVYVPIWNILPSSLKGAKNLILEAHGSGYIWQVNFIAETMATNIYWTPLNKWLGFLRDPENANEFSWAIRSGKIPNLWNEAFLSTQVLRSAMESGVSQIMMRGLFETVQDDALDTYDILCSVFKFNYTETYNDFFIKNVIGHFAEDTWRCALVDRNYKVIEFMLKFSEPPDHICLDYIMLRFDDEEAMDVLYISGRLNEISSLNLRSCIEAGKHKAVAKLIEYGIYTPTEGELDHWRIPRPYEKPIDEKMLQLLQDGIVGRKS